MPQPQRTERVQSGDVSLFVRVFGQRGATPVLLMHGANYFDSRDWIEVAERLASDREVAAFDKRGFGESDWSPAKDYSVEANMADMRAVIAALGWRSPIIVGHSASGRLAISFAADFPNELARLVVVDSNMEKEPGGPIGSTGNPPLVFPSVDAAVAEFAKLKQTPRIGLDRARAVHALKPVSGGLMLKRDPDFQHAVRTPRDPWAELARVTCPVLMVRGLRSDRYSVPTLERLQREFPRIVWATADAQHDVPGQAPDVLAAAIRDFIAEPARLEAR